MIFVITSNENLANRLTTQLERGVTVIASKGGYTKKENWVILCAIRVYEVARFRQNVKKADPNAFMMVTNVTEILGEGFKKLD